MNDQTEAQIRIRELQNSLQRLDVVAAATLDEKRTPERLAIELTTQAPTPHVEDLLQHYDAAIHDPEGTDDGLAFDVTVPEPYRDAGVRKLRGDNRSSNAVTIPGRALEVSGLTTGDDLDIDARPGEILLTAADD